MTKDIEWLKTLRRGPLFSLKDLGYYPVPTVLKVALRNTKGEKWDLVFGFLWSNLTLKVSPVVQSSN